MTKRLFAVIALAVVVVIGITIAIRFGLLHAADPGSIRLLIGRIRAFPYVEASFVGLYTLAAASGVPATPLVIVGGVLFGPVDGVLLNWLADMLAASLSFGIARFITPLQIETRDARVGEARGFLGLLRLRVIPVVPFAVLNYGSAIYGMQWKSFLGATAIGIIPSTVVYTLFASSLAAGVTGAGGRAILMAAVCGVVIIGLSLLPRLSRWKGVSSGTIGHE